jgi:GNAT superfamily N-acetyltransferase
MKDEIAESNRQLREAWKLYAQASPHGETLDKHGLSVADAGQPWFFVNVGALSTPVLDGRDLQRRAREAMQHFARRGNPWILTASENWFGTNANALLADVGLVYKFDMVGMAADRLLPPVRPLPEVQLRRIGDEETISALADLNAASYEVPSEWGRLAIGGPALWRSAIYGTVAYVGNEPASGTFALPIDDALYIAWVATAKAHRGRGLAELVIRKSLADAKEATGLERTVLHATKDGRPVYHRMGYHDVVKFPCYGPM